MNRYNTFEKRRLEQSLSVADMIDRQNAYATYHQDILDSVIYLVNKDFGIDINCTDSHYSVTISKNFTSVHDLGHKITIPKRLDIEDPNFWCNYDNLRSLQSIIDDHKEFKETQQKLQLARLAALEKLTPEERVLLGLST